MSLICKQGAGEQVLNSSAITSAEGSVIGDVSIYNADASPTTFTFKFIDSSEGDLVVTLKQLTIPAQSTNNLGVRVILTGSDELKVFPSAGGGTHEYTFGEFSNRNILSSKAHVITDTSLTTIANTATRKLFINIFNNKNLLADSPVLEAFDGINTNIYFKQSIQPLSLIQMSLPSLKSGDTIKIRASSGSSSDFHIYQIYV